MPKVTFDNTHNRMKWKTLIRQALDNLFPVDVVTTLRVRDFPINPPPKGLEMHLEPSAKVGENLGLNNLFFFRQYDNSFSEPHDSELFLVGTETGLIHRGSFDDKVCNATYEDHKDKVTFIQWNYLHPRVFLSCSNDYTLQIWDHKER
ncbi:dynein intermediate chain 1, axonemal [Caerostris extrusa]|uniref:Dynein intermediate chain 1, axonemal n=1 Tax=Caerostris extrusa TaxID=172846 RepID=A0AAV4WVQ1_CAEEX|nr:dynein intermediate chain 1, axonemal [Caerostris extrusa]